ncbi:MAG TPA: SMP-30/gluconolactonase/LRE family protein [Actinomycetota bacterium]
MVRTGRSAAPRSHRPWVVVLALAVAAAAAPAVLAAPGDVDRHTVPTANAGVSDVAVAPDGTVWFTERLAGAIGRLDPATGAIEEIPLDDVAAGPAGVAVAADGSVWFAQDGGNAIGRRTPAGDLVDHDLPTAASRPTDVAVAPDGTVWFSEAGANRIGRVAQDGSITEWDTPTSRTGAIAVDTDGVVWFVELGTQPYLTSFDPTTETFDQRALAGGSGPSGVAVAPDGSIWVTLRLADAVVRLDRATQAFTTVPLDADARPSAVAIASDGAAWISETGLGRLARLTPAAVDAFELGGATGPQGVALDVVGRVWVAEAAANAVTSFEPPGAEPVDETPPTVEIRAPVDGQWTTRDAPLLSDYACADEGGSGLASCDGPVASGAPVPATRLGAHRFEVVATDGAGNIASAETRYLVFRSVDAPPGWTTLRAGGGGVRLSLGMDLPSKGDPDVTATSALVDCATGAGVADAEPSDVRERVANDGTLELRWLAPRSWRGVCRTLTLAYGAVDWSGATATFGPYLFG